MWGLEIVEKLWRREIYILAFHPLHTLGLSIPRGHFPMSVCLSFLLSYLVLSLKDKDGLLCMSVMHPPQAHVFPSSDNGF